MNPKNANPSPPLDAATLRAVKLAREAANGWACFAKRDKEHAEIARIHEALNAIERSRSGHDAQCEAELTSHGYTPCRCRERAGICYCRKNPCECLPLADAAAPCPVWCETCRDTHLPDAPHIGETPPPPAEALVTCPSCGGLGNIPVGSEVIKSEWRALEEHCTALRAQVQTLTAQNEQLWDRLRAYENHEAVTPTQE